MIYIAGYDPQRVGGGWGFSRNFYKMFKDDITFNFDEAKTYFIPGASMTSREEVEKAKKQKKKIVLRVDNALLPSNNRGGGMSHLKDYASVADEVVYQSKWSQAYLKGFLGKPGRVILNAVDQTVFNAKGRIERPPTVYGYARSSRHDTKGWEAARYYFSRLYEASNERKLFIIGKFSGENIEYNFNFYNGENFTFLGEQPPEKMPELYRQIDIMIIPYFNDACSNTVIEALSCGCKLFDNPFLSTGGTPEILINWEVQGAEYFNLPRMKKEYEAVVG